MDMTSARMTTVGILVLTVALTATSVHLVARVWNPRRMFFIDLGRDMTDAERARVRRMLWFNVFCAFVSTVLVAVTANELVMLLAIGVIPLLPIVWLIVEATRVGKSLPKRRIPRRFIIPIGEQPGILDYLSMPLVALDVALIALASAVFAVLRSGLPESVPMHWNARGEVDRYGSPNEMWLMLGLMLFDLMLVFLISWSVTRERTALPPENPDEAARLMRARRTGIVVMTQKILLWMDAGYAVAWVGMTLALRPGQDALVFPAIAACLLTMFGGIALTLVQHLPGLHELRNQLADLDAEALGTREEGWKWGGAIYYAPEDPAVFVPKKLGIGSTLNFGRPGAWVFIGVITAAPLIVTIAIIALANA